MPLDPNRFTRKTQEAFGAAQARRARHRQHRSVVAAPLARAARSARRRRHRRDRADRRRPRARCVATSTDELDQAPRVSGATVRDAQLAAEAFRLLEEADKERAGLDDEYLSTEHILLAMTNVPGGVGDLLRALGVYARRSARRAEAGARLAPGDERQPRGAVPGAREVRPRSHRRGARRQDRSGHRPRRRDPPHHPGVVAPHQEQPRADRRARCRQDRDRRGFGPPHRRGRRAGRAAQQACRRARHRFDGRGRQVPRRVRGAVQGRPQGDRRFRGRDRHVHRRVAHDRRRGRCRGRGRRRQHDQADAGARRAAHDRRDHARRVPQVHREGRSPRASVPAGVRRPAVGRGHDRDPARPEGALRGPPRRPHPGRGPRRGVGALGSLHHRRVSSPTRRST